jgi:hypothetical protein
MSETAGEFLAWLLDANAGYSCAVALPGDRYACLSIRMHNTQIITARIGDRTGWDNAW